MSQITSTSAAPSNDVPVVTLIDTTVEGLASRPDSLQIEDAFPPPDGSGYNRERRGSKSCLKVTNHDGASGASLVSGELSSPMRRRSVHWDSSPASTVEVPASKDEKEQRGCGSLKGPAPYAGKEVFVKGPGTLNTEDGGSEDEEEERRLALAQAIARRQSAPCSMVFSEPRQDKPRLHSPPPSASLKGNKPRLHSPPPLRPQSEDEEAEVEAEIEAEGKESPCTTSPPPPSPNLTTSTTAAATTTTTESISSKQLTTAVDSLNMDSVHLAKT